MYMVSERAETGWRRETNATEGDREGREADSKITVQARKYGIVSRLVKSRSCDGVVRVLASMISVERVAKYRIIDNTNWRIFRVRRQVEIE